MQDHAQPIRAKLIAETPIDTPLDLKRASAIAYLGENWMMHPNYKMQPRHAFSVSRWQPHSVLRQVAIQAQQAGRI